MLRKGTAKKVTIFINEATHNHHHLTSPSDSILTYLLRKGVSGATATRATAGFGAHQTLDSGKADIFTAHLPVRIEFIESAEMVDELMPALYDMVSDGLIEVQDTNVVKVANEKDPAPLRGPHTELRGAARLMRIYLGESDKWQDEPLYEAIVKRLRLMDIAGATVYRGILGFGVKGHTHKSGLLPFSHDLPVVISVVDSPEKLAQAIERIEPMMQDGLIVLSDVDVIRLVRGHPEAAHADH